MLYKAYEANFTSPRTSKHNQLAISNELCSDSKRDLCQMASRYWRVDIKVSGVSKLVRCYSRDALVSWDA